MQTHIVLVICTFHLSTVPLDNARERFADGVAHEMADVEFFERIGVGIFDDRLLALVERALAPHFVMRDDLAEILGEECVSEKYIDEAGTGDLYARDQVGLSGTYLAELLRDRLCELARVHLLLFGEHERDIGRVESPRD